MQKRIRARVQRSKYLSLLSGIESREAKPLPDGNDTRPAGELHDIQLSNHFIERYESKNGERAQSRDLQSADPS